ncbi:hypothetical protein LTR53_017900 [Teratosphaeriaceae sp. CCFEE 6253]|nr:hypothetical protein LTR53_017900 [Teratosphaeriaceae sp. CCFEE 6253]
MEAYAAYDLARLGQCDTALALAKRIESIGLINAALSRPETAYQNSTLGAILGAIAIDVQPASAALRVQHRAEARVHVSGLARVLAARGGPTQLPAWTSVFYHWMDVQTSGLLSSAAHTWQYGEAENSHHTFSDTCFHELKTLYAAAYIAARGRQDSQSSLSALFSPGTSFCSLLALGAAARSPARIAALIYSNMIVLDCNSDADAVQARLAKSALLARLLRTGRGTTEALAFALITSDLADGNHAIEDPARASALTRCLHAYRQLPDLMQSHVESALMNLLLADRMEAVHLWRPATFRQCVGEGIKTGDRLVPEP